MEEDVLAVNDSGNGRAVTLLSACAFVDAIDAIEGLPEDRRESADYENLGIAYEAIGELSQAQHAYAKAVELDSDNGNAAKRMGRIEEIMAGRDALRNAGLKASDETSFRK